MPKEANSIKGVFNLSYKHLLHEKQFSIQLKQEKMKVRERIPHIRFYMQGDPCLSRITLGIRLIWGIHSFTLILFVLGLYDIFFMYNSSFIINCPFRTPYSLCKLNLLCSLYCCRMQIEKRRCHHYYVCFVPAIKINILVHKTNG